MKNLNYLLPFVLFTALPHSQNNNKVTTEVVMKNQVDEIIQHKADSLTLVADSLRYDVKDLKQKQDRIYSLLAKEKQLERKLQSILEEKQYKRITEEFDF